SQAGICRNDRRGDRVAHATASKMPTLPTTSAVRSPTVAPMAPPSRAPRGWAPNTRNRQVALARPSSWSGTRDRTHSARRDGQHDEGWRQLKVTREVEDDQSALHGPGHGPNRGRDRDG